MVILTRHHGATCGVGENFKPSAGSEGEVSVGASLRCEVPARGLRVTHHGAWAGPSRHALPHQRADLASSTDRILGRAAPSAGRLDVKQRDFIGAFRTVAMLVLETEARGEPGEISPGSGSADTVGGAWEIILDHCSPTVGHERGCFVPDDVRPVCRGENDIDGRVEARYGGRRGVRGANHSDPRDGFWMAPGTAPPRTPTLTKHS